MYIHIYIYIHMYTCIYIRFIIVYMIANGRAPSLALEVCVFLYIYSKDTPTCTVVSP